MTISGIRATFECDGCGKQFRVDIDPAVRAWQRRQDMMSVAEDAIRGGTTSEGEFCSLQADLHLCGCCTSVADSINADDENYQPTADDIRAALA